MDNSNEIYLKTEKILKESSIHFNKIFDGILSSPDLKKVFKDSIHLQNIQLLHRKVISLMQSVLILNLHFKYSEAKMLIRNMFESTMLMLYFSIRNYEAKRWLDWQCLTFQQKDEIPQDFKHFKIYLEDNGYTQTSNIISLKNFSGLKYFKPSYIKKAVFENHENIKASDFKEFSDIMNNFSHPTFLSLNLNDKFNQEIYDDNLKVATHLYLQAGSIFIDSISSMVNSKFVEDFKSFMKDSIQ